MTKIEINIGRQHLLFLAVFAVILAGLAGISYVIAIGSGDYQVHGHDAGEVDIDMSNVCLSDGTNCPVGAITLTNCEWTSFVDDVLAGGGATGTAIYCPAGKVAVGSQWYVADHMWADQRLRCCDVVISGWV